MIKTIEEFEKASRKFNENYDYRTFTQIAFDNKYYDVLTTYDTELEIDLFTFNENTMIALVEYLESINCAFLRPDYIPNLSSDLERLGRLDEPKIRLLYESAKKLNGTCEEKYMYDQEIKRYRTQIKVSGKHVRTFYDFVKKTEKDLMELTNKYVDAIQVTPYQVDNVVAGRIVYLEGKEFGRQLEFKFNTNSQKEMFVTAAMLNQTIRNQEEFDELGFNKTL